MTQYRVTDTELSGIADAIRTKGGTSAPLVFPSGFVSAIGSISGSANLGSISISSNGTYTPTGGLDGFDSVVVDVQGGITPSGSINISQNGTYDVSSFANAVVDVPQSGGENQNYRILMEMSVGNIVDNELSVAREGMCNGNGSVTGASLPNVQYVYNSAFCSCSNLAFAYLPSAKKIYYHAFSTCNNLSDINVQSVEEIGGSAFRNCANIRQIGLPSCLSIASSAFYGCSGLQFISAPNLKSLGSYAFYSCSSISFAYFENLSQIGGSAFYGCRSLASVYLLSSSVANLANAEVFYYTPMSGSGYIGGYGSIYVPSSLVEAYKSAQRWSLYSSRITAYTE